MQEVLHETMTPSNLRTEPNPCRRCQYGIMDIPTDGKMNCFLEGPGNVKTLTKEEVEEMVFCDKMAHWAKMDIPEFKKTE